MFVTTTGSPIEPKILQRALVWYRCLRSLGIRQRGLYCTKDTFVTVSLEAGVRIAWLEQQTGVNYLTLRRHYGKWMPQDRESELRRFAALEPSLFGEIVPRKSQVGGTISITPETISGTRVRGGGLEPDGGARRAWISQRFTSAGIRK